jgi:hypothetical protein
MWTKEGDGDFAAAAYLAFESFADFYQREVGTQVGS